MRAAKLWLWAGLLWLLTGSSVFGQEWPSPFRHLPENTMAVVHVRVEALLKSAWGKAALMEVLGKKDVKETFQKLNSELGIDPFDVESATFLLLDPVLAGDQEPRPSLRNRWNGPVLSPPPTHSPRLGGYPPEATNPLSPPPPPPVLVPTNRSLTIPAANASSEFVSVTTQGSHNDSLLPLVIIHSRKPIDRKQFMRKKVDLGGNGPSSLGLMFLSDQSFVIGPDHAVVQFAANTSDKESDLGRQLANEHARPMIQGGYRLAAPMKKELLTDPSGAGPLSLVFPLVNVTTATFGLDLGKPADFKLRLNAANDRQANLAAQSAKTLLAVAEAYCETALPELEKNALAAADEKAKSEARDAVVIVKGLRQMAGNARVEQRQSEVLVALQMEIQTRHVVLFLEGILNRHESPRVLAH